MKITIGNYEVDIKAKKEYNSKMNQKDVEFLLNELCIVYNEAGTFNACQGYQGIAKDYHQKSNEIYKQLQDVGAYNNK